MNKITLGFLLKKSKTTVKVLVLFVFLLMNSQMSWGQTPYVMSGGNYSETFTNIANATNWPIGFTGGTDSAEWFSVPVTTGVSIGDGIKTTVLTSTFVTGSSGGLQRGTANIQMLSTGTTNACAIDLKLDFTGRTAGTVSFDAATVFNSTGDRDSKLKLFWSIDGTTFTELTGTNLPFTARNNVASSLSITSIALPAAFNNSSTARLRFYQYSTTTGATPTGSQAKISIDNVSVTSTAAAVPVVSAASPTGTVGTAFNYQVVASNSPTSYAITIGTLPDGLNLNTTTGAITGTPTTAGSLTVDVKATNGAGPSIAATLSFTIIANTTVDWCNIQWPPTQTISEGTTFTVFAQANKSGLTEAAGQGAGLSGWIGYRATNSNPNTGSWTWIPATFNTQVGNNDEFMATLGTGLTPGTYFYASRFQIDAGSYVYGGITGIWNSITDNGVLTVNAVLPVVSAAAPTGTVGSPFTYNISAINFPTSYAISSGTLPAGLSLDTTTGAITGTPTAAGTPTVDVTATNGAGTSATATLSFTIAKGSQVITFGALPAKITTDADFSPGATSTTSGINAITYTSSNELVATIVSGAIHIVGAGTTTITASQAGSVNYLAATDVPRTLNVLPIPIAAWDFTGTGPYTTLSATTFNSNLISSAGSSDVTRGAGAASSAGSNSFRTVGFQNNGISTANTDYFQVTLQPTAGNSLSLSTIDANLIGTTSFAASTGVSSQFAYSLDGTTFTLIGSPQVIVGTPQALAQIDLSGVTALQNVPNGTTVTLRYYASGQTTTGGWGFSSASAGVNGLAIGGTVSPAPPTTAIPDSNFEQALIDLGKDDVIDGKVITANISGIETLDVSGKSISDLTGIQDFVDLKDLRCSSNTLTSLNVTTLTNLEVLYCDNNLLTALDVHLSPNLYYLICENNAITNLNITGLTKLQVMGCLTNQLTAVNVSANPGLYYLDVDDNLLTSLVVTTGSNLNELYCNTNLLTTLDLSGLTNLDFFEAKANALTCVIVDNETLVKPTFISDPLIPEWTVDDRSVFGYNTVLLADIISADPVLSIMAPVANIKCSKNITATTTATFPITVSTVVTWTFDDGLGNIITSNQNIIIGTIWNGSSWSNTTGPDASLEAIIAGNYNSNTVGSGFIAKKLTINSGSLTLYSPHVLFITNEVINNAGINGLVIESGANLIQTSNVGNTGAITVKRDSNPLYRLDYTMWSSPTGVSQKLNEFSPLTTTGRFYEYNPSSNLYNVVADATPFSQGKGFLIRMPNTDPKVGYDEGSVTLAYPGIFTGIPNNGEVTVAGTTGQYIAVGNPYPSNINADDFINANTDTPNTGVLYFWRKTNNLNQGSAPTTSYATYTKAGSTITSDAGSGGITPNGKIAVGQGFITTVPALGIKFTNSMRTFASALFLKTKATAQKDRVWINLTNTNGAFSQMLVTYMDGATTGVDNGIDGKYINDSATALTSNIDGGEYVIQGRPTFDASDVVNLNFKTATDGTFTIAKDHVDGLFATGQAIYLVDAATGTETNLQTDAYTFTAAAGASNARFSLKFQKTLGVNPVAFDENSISVFKQNGVLSINAGNTLMKNVKVFDIQGRLILEQKEVNATTTTLKNLAAGKQAVLIQITSDDNRVVTKKAIN